MGNAVAACIVNALTSIVLCTGKGAWLLLKLGFTATGIVAGSLAACAMAFFGNVEAASNIARATSMAMRV